LFDMDQLVVKKTTWQQDRDLILEIRFEVFVHEQLVPEDEEVDEHDPDAQPWLFPANETL